jgi:hypothetical protein
LPEVGSHHKTGYLSHSVVNSEEGGALVFDPQLTAAEWYLGSMSPDDLPAFACEALEQGHDGKNLRRLAGLVKPTRGDAGEIADAALRELSVTVPLSKDEAALWTLNTVKSSASSAEITALNFIGKMLTALPELEKPYLERLKSHCGHPGNYEAVFNYLRPALKEDIAKGSTTDFLRRSSSFIEQVCRCRDLEATNVLWIELFEWLVHSPAGELKFLWPILGPSTRATIKQVALRRRETENLP